MASDQERREVALRLRGAKYGWHSWERALYDALGVDTETAGLDMLDSLADLIETSCDRDALLALAEDVDGAAEDSGGFEPLAGMLHDIAHRIREALGVDDG